MVIQIHDKWLEERIIQDRQERRIDRHDEAWDGIYTIFPPKDNEHQTIRGDLTTILNVAMEWDALGDVYPGVNVSDRKENWLKNYRCPDVVVFLNDTHAENRGTHWFGGPDLAIEIVNPHDRSREKLEFYAKVNTRELLIVDRDPWALELFRLVGGKLVSVGNSTIENGESLASDTVPLTLKLIAGDQRPSIEIRHHDGKQRWTV